MRSGELVLPPAESRSAPHESPAHAVRRIVRCRLVPARSFAMSLLAIIARTFLGLAPAPAPSSAATPAPPRFATTAPLLATPVATPVAAAATAPSTAAEVVDRVQQFYAGIKQVTASFRQAVTNDTFGSTK